MHNFPYLRVMSMGGDFFFKTWICMTMFFAQYLGCYSTIFSQILVCCSWDYGLSVMWSQIFNQMSGTWSNFQFKMSFQSTQRLNFCQGDDVTVYKDCVTTSVQISFLFLSVWILCWRYLKNGMSNHEFQIFTVSLPWWGMDTITFSAWSPNHDVI